MIENENTNSTSQSPVTKKKTENDLKIKFNLFLDCSTK